MYRTPQVTVMDNDQVQADMTIRQSGMRERFRLRGAGQ